MVEIIDKIKSLFKREEKSLIEPEIKEEVKPEIDYEERKRLLFEQAIERPPLDEYDHSGMVIYYYWIHTRLHGLCISQDMARNMYESQKHVIQETMEYANRLPRKET